MFDSKYWVDIFQMQETRFVVLVTLLGIIVCIGIYLVKLFRDLAIGGGDNGSEELLTRIRDLKESGLVDDKEYRRLNQSLHRQAASKNSLISHSRPDNKTDQTSQPETEAEENTDEQPDFEEWNPRDHRN